MLFISANTSLPIALPTQVTVPASSIAYLYMDVPASAWLFNVSVVGATSLLCVCPSLHAFAHIFFCFVVIVCSSGATQTNGYSTSYNVQNNTANLSYRSIERTKALQQSLAGRWGIAVQNSNASAAVTVSVLLSVSNCVSDCNSVTGNGWCQQDTGTCVCARGYTGTSCATGVFVLSAVSHPCHD